MIHLNQQQLEGAAFGVGLQIARRFREGKHTKSTVKIYGIPRGGISAAYLVALKTSFVQVVDDAAEADCYVDDLIDSGATLKRWSLDGKPFFALFDKRKYPWKGKWLVFPWEGSASGSFEDNIIRLIQFVGDDPNRGGLKETPARVAKAWQHWCSGYGKDPKDILKVFKDGGEVYDEMVTSKNIPVFSHCEHHLAPIFGTATVSYIPKGKIVGLSKINRLVDLFSRRLQVQERLTDQIAQALYDNLRPKGVGVSIKARHFCIESRGVQHSNSETVTTALLGALKTKPAARQEFLRECK